MRWAKNFAAYIHASQLVLHTGICTAVIASQIVCMVCRAVTAARTSLFTLTCAAALLQLSDSADTRDLWVDQYRWGDQIPLDGSDIR